MIDERTMTELCNKLEPIFDEIARHFLPGESVEVHFSSGSVEFKITDTVTSELVN